MFFDINFDFTINNSSINPQFQKSSNPNPSRNPNFDRVTHEALRDQLDREALYLKDVSDYLMLEENSDERDLSQDHKENVANIICDESSSSVLGAGDKKYRRAVKKYNSEKQEFRVAFRTKSKLEIMDDGFKWRKYGKKRVKSSPNLRNYYKCSEGGCSVKKRVERDGNDSSYVITTYQGLHNHHTPTSTCLLYY